MRQSWTDERMDVFREETTRRFDEVDRRLDRVDVDIREMSSRFERVDARLDELNRTMLRFGETLLKLGGGAIVTFVVGFVGLIATQL